MPKHRRRHESGHGKYCRFCLLPFTVKNDCHNASGQEPYSCPYCDGTFTRVDNLRRHLVERRSARDRKREQQPYVQVPVLPNRISATFSEEQNLHSFYGSDGGSDPETDQSDDVEMVDVISLGSDTDSPVSIKQQIPAAQDESRRDIGGPHGSPAQSDDGDYTEEDVLDMWLKPSTTTSLGEQQGRSSKSELESPVKYRSSSTHEVRRSSNHSETKRASSEVHQQRCKTAAKSQNLIVDNDTPNTAPSPTHPRHALPTRNFACPVVLELDLAPYSETFLQLCAQAYIRNYHQLFPFLHINTIRSSKPLLPVIAAVGSLSSNSSQILTQGRQLLQLVQNAIQTRLDRSVESDSGTETTLLQAAVLLLCTVLISDVQTQFRDAYKMHGIMATRAQKFGLFRIDPSARSEKYSLSNRQIPSWKAWYTTEEEIRTILMLYIFDAELFITQGHKTLLDHGPTKVPHASSDALFAASSLEDWSALYRHEKASEKSRLTAYSRLGSIRAAICEAHINSTMTAERIRRLENRLQDLYTDFLGDGAEPSSDVMGLKLLWHASFISLCTDPQTLNKALSDDISQLDDRQQSYVREWSISSAGQRSVLHALAIKQIVIKWPLIQEPPLHFPQVVFLAGLCMYCFIRFGSFQIEDSDQSSFVAIDFPELDMDGMNVISALTELGLSARSGRPLPIAYNSSFHDLLVVLESKRHSTISSQLARRLRSAIERGSEESLPNTLFNPFTTNGDVSQPARSQSPSRAAANRVKVYDLDVDLGPTGTKKSLRLLGQKRKRSQADNDSGEIERYRRTDSPRLRGKTKSGNEPAEHATNDKPHPDFPSCVPCFEMSRICTKPWGKSQCDYCFEKGISCARRLRPLGQTTTSRHHKGELAERKCRRCVQKAYRCARSHGPSAPCDNCCYENRYCYSNTAGVVPRTDTKHKSQHGASDAVVQKGPAQGQEEDHTGYENFEDTISDDGGDEDGDGGDSETIMVSSARNTSNSGAIKPEAQPCRRCYYDGMPCNKPDGPDSRCKRCVSCGKRCNPDLTGIQPYIRRGKQQGEHNKRHQSRAEARNSSHQMATDTDDYSASEAEQGFLPPAFNFGVWSESVPCRRCYYDGRRCYKIHGKENGCRKCSGLGMRCNPDLTGVRPYVKRSFARKGKPHHVELYDRLVDLGSSSALARDHEAIGTDEIHDVDVQTERTRENEAPDADAEVDATDNEDDVGEMTAIRRDYGVRDRPFTASARGKFRRTEAINVNFMTQIGEKWSSNSMQSNDPLVIWSDWLPKGAPLPDRCPPELRPCRKCFYECHYCYKSRGRDEACDSCFGKTNCYSDLTGIIPYRYKRVKEREKMGLLTRLQKQSLELQARKLEAFKSDIEMTNFEQTLTFDDAEDDVEGYFEDDFEGDSMLQQEAADQDPLVIYQQYRPKVQGRHDIIAEPRPCRQCFINCMNCYKPNGPDSRCDRCCYTRVKCTSDLQGAVPWKHKSKQEGLQGFTRLPYSSQRRHLSRNDGKNQAGVASGADLEADYLSISSGTERTQVEQVVADRDWSSASEEEIDENDEGLKTLTLYQANPPKARNGEPAERIPCRRCLLERLCCQKPNGPGTACTLCRGRIDAGHNQKCTSDLRGAARYPSKYGIDAVPGDFRPRFLGPGLGRVRQPGKPFKWTGLTRPSRPAVAARPSQVRHSPAADTFVPQVPRADGQPESDESIIARMFDGNAEDTGWKLLQQYFQHRRATRDQFGHPPERIPCRACLRKRLNCVKENGAAVKCVSCVTRGAKSRCSHDLRGALGYDRNWANILPPELRGPINTRTSRSMVRERQRSSSTGSERQYEDYLENYIEIEEDDESDEAEDASNIDEQSIMDRSIEPEDVLSSMFDNDASYPGFQTLQWYLSRRRVDTRNRDVDAEKIPCRRCLRANLRCHVVNGPGASCRECARPNIRARCISDLRGAELYNGVRK